MKTQTRPLHVIALLALATGARTALSDPVDQPASARVIRAATPTATPSAAAFSAASSTAIDAEKTRLTKAQVDALPDAQVLLYKEQRYTAGQLKALAREAASRRSELQGSAEQAQARFFAFRDQFLAKQQAALDAEKAKGLAAYQSRFGNRAAVTR